VPKFLQNLCELLCSSRHLQKRKQHVYVHAKCVRNTATPEGTKESLPTAAELVLLAVLVSLHDAPCLLPLKQGPPYCLAAPF
jgi:hypothetical protein